jgi:HSP20 family molecular chaperone IbpA
MANDRQIARRDPFGSLFSDPWGEIAGRGNPLARVSRLMDDFLGEGSAGIGFPLDLTETDDTYVLTVEVPGVKKDDLSIECSDQTFTIRAEKRPQRDPERERAFRLERRYGVFARSVQLPEDANLERIDATFEEGVLRVAIEKKPESKPRKIEIH